MARIPFAPNYLESIRDFNVPLYAAIGELIDNSIEWHATEIRVFLNWIKHDHGKPEKLVVIDNGEGMDHEILTSSLILGKHNESNSSYKMSKFGVGSTQAFISNCKKSEVYSKKKHGKWMYTFLDLSRFPNKIEHFEDIKVDFPPDAVERDPPSEYRTIWSKLDSGTITVWTDFDKGIMERHDVVPFWISRAYRKYIGDKFISYKITKEGQGESSIQTNKNPIKIYYNEDLLRAYDPLYVLPYRKGDKGGKLYQPIVLPAINQKGTKSNIIIQFGLCPEEWRTTSPGSSLDPINVEERYIQGGKVNVPDIMDSRLMGVLRCNREIAWLSDGWLYGRREDKDRWWGMEIIYEDTHLDQIFGVEPIKIEVNFNPELRATIRRLISPTVQNMRDEIQRVFDLSAGRKEKALREKEKKGKTSILQDVDPGVLKNISDTEQSPNEILINIIHNESERVKLLEELSRKKLVIVPDFERRVPKDTNLMFEYSSKGGEVLMVRYMNHIWLKRKAELDNKLQNNSNLTSEDIIDYLHESNQLWDMFLESLVVNLALLHPNEVEQKLIDRLLSSWGKLCYQMVEKREELKSK